MDEDKNPAPETTDAGQAAQSTADPTINLADVDPRLIIADEEPEEVEPTTEPQAEAQVEPEPEETAPAETSTEPEAQAEEPEPSPRQNKAIERLTKKLAESHQVTQPTQPQQPNSQVIGEGEYDLNQINDLAQQHGDQRFAEGVKESNNSILFMTRLELDAPKVESKYERLNPRSDSFDPGVADYTTQLYKKIVGLKAKSDGTFTVENPNIRYEEFIDGMMEAVDTLASSKVADSKANLVKQAAQTGVRPNTVTKKVYQGDDPSKMTIEQLRAKVNQELGIS